MIREERHQDTKELIQQRLLFLALTEFLNEMEKSIKRQPQPHRFLQKIVDGGIQVHKVAFLEGVQ